MHSSYSFFGESGLQSTLWKCCHSRFLLTVVKYPITNVCYEISKFMEGGSVTLYVYTLTVQLFMVYKCNVEICFVSSYTNFKVASNTARSE